MNHEQAKRLFVAVRSTHQQLSQDRGEAVLMASAHVNLPGLLLMRLRLLNDSQAFGEALREFQPLVRRRLNRNGRQVSGTRARQVCTRALRAWLFSTCLACEGRGRTTIEGTPVLSDEDCERCNGTGVYLHPSINETFRAHCQVALRLFDDRYSLAVGELRGQLNRSDDDGKQPG